MARTETIYERKDGRFEARFIASRDDEGKAVYKAIYGKSKAEVREKVAAAKKEIYGEPSPYEDKTFREVAEEWLLSCKGQIASTTYDRYKEALERDVYPEYSDTPMQDVTVEEMNRFLVLAPGLAEKRGRTLQYSGLQVMRAAMSNVIQYASDVTRGNSIPLPNNISSYEELSAEQVERICIRAKYNHTQEMLAVLLVLFCGTRNGELCALSCDDVDIDRMELFIHRTAHRISNPDKDAENKTALVVEEIPRKKQIRRVRIPEVLKSYIQEFMIPGRMLIRNREGLMVDPRNLENRLTNTLDAFGLSGINSERLRKTYQKGISDEQILTNIFLGIRPDRPYRGSVDITWLRDEMSKDLAPLRLLVGLSHDEMGSILGISEGIYRGLENGSHDISWDQYLALLFVFHYNGRTIDIVDNLGLFPQALKEKMKIGQAVRSQ